MENLDLLRTLIKKYGGNTPKPDKKELYKTILNYYCEREPMTNDEKEFSRIEGLSLENWVK